MSLKNINAIVIGASGGIGSEICKALSEQGVHLILVGLTESSLELVAKSCAKGITTEVIACDLTSRDACQSVVDKAIATLGRIDVIINTAGRMSFGLIEAQTPEELSKLFQVNVFAIMHLTQAILPHFKKNGKGHFVNIGSTFGSIGYAGFASYSASKFALRGFTESLRRELSDTSIAVSYVAPRATKTSLNSDAVYEMNQELGVAMDSPRVVAKEVVACVIARSADVYMGWPEKFFVKLNSVFPRIVDSALAKKLQRIKHYASR